MKKVTEVIKFFINLFIHNKRIDSPPPHMPNNNNCIVPPNNHCHANHRHCIVDIIIGRRYPDRIAVHPIEPWIVPPRTWTYLLRHNGVALVNAPSTFASIFVVSIKQIALRSERLVGIFTNVGKGLELILDKLNYAWTIFELSVN